ncbi:lipase class 3 [Nitzschia inconspicua]|uniref:Lipase class 3 n=1 Tax=Nitzschia inconspicua TaxID=303405 RepID=A0A9K3M286_9STRA|nr:lipase class 3 [Nitzschia inconspicua]
MTKVDTVDIAVDADALDEISRGMMLAELAITDNKKDTLKNVAKFNPWHEQALKHITGSKQRAHLPLKDILYEDMGELILDCEIDVRGITKGGHFLDTQGYVAHNNDYVVVAFRCTTSIFDWLTNLNTSSSAWEIDVDAPQGYSGICSSLDGLCFQGENYKPRVHTGFYNNFLATLPTIRKHVDRYLVSYERPRTLYIVGHSLGAGIANMTATYFLLHHDWTMLPQNLVAFTAGSPRSICQSMKKVVDDKRQEYGEKNVRFYRLVKGKDAVTTVPPKLLGFVHMVEPTVITDEGGIVLRLKEVDAETNVMDLVTIQKDQICQKYLTSSGNKSLESEMKSDMDEETDEESDDEAETKYNNLVARIPKALRDHMPDFYLKPLFRAKGINVGTIRPNEEAAADDTSESDKAGHQKTRQIGTIEETTEKKVRPWVPKVFRRKKQLVPEVGPFF